MEPTQLFFKDDGIIPNSKFPLLIYKHVFAHDKSDPDSIIEYFANRGWTNAWDNGVFDYHHYHSVTHEVLGVHSGYATVKFGGEQGQEVSVEEGDVIVIPAGVGHKCISASDDFGVIGAYPDGRDYDIRKGDDGDRPDADENIAKVPIPENDPVYGKMQGLVTLWKLKE